MNGPAYAAYALAAKIRQATHAAKTMQLADAYAQAARDDCMRLPPRAKLMTDAALVAARQALVDHVETKP